MLDVFGLFSVETLYVLIGIIALLVIAIVLSIVAIAKSSSMKKKYKEFMGGSDGTSIEELIFILHDNGVPEYEISNYLEISIKYVEEILSDY